MDNKITSEEQLEQIKEAFDKKILKPGQIARSFIKVQTYLPPKEQWCRRE